MVIAQKILITTTLAAPDFDDNGCDVLNGPFTKTGFGLNQCPVLPIGYVVIFYEVQKP